MVCTETCYYIHAYTSMLILTLFFHTSEGSSFSLINLSVNKIFSKNRLIWFDPFYVYIDTSDTFSCVQRLGTQFHTQVWVFVSLPFSTPVALPS